MTVALYARLHFVNVHLRHSRVHAVDCAECEPKEGHIDRIEWSFLLIDELTAEERQGLLDIAQGANRSGRRLRSRRLAPMQDGIDTARPTR